MGGKNKSIPEAEGDQELENRFDSKAMLTDAANDKHSIKQGESVIEVGRIIRYNERKKVEIIENTRHYKVGQVINPHVVMADALIKQGIAKEAKSK